MHCRPLGRKSRPTIFSRTELLPALWLPTTTSWGRSTDKEHHWKWWLSQIVWWYQGPFQVRPFETHLEAFGSPRVRAQLYFPINICLSQHPNMYQYRNERIHRSRTMRGLRRPGVRSRAEMAVEVQRLSRDLPETPERQTRYGVSRESPERGGENY